MWPFKPARIYLDNASATPVCAEALSAMNEALTACGNPSAIHAEGVAAKRVLEESRATIAEALQVKPREVLFVSGSTEANNLSIVGYARRLLLEHGTLSRTHWIVSAIEHPSVLESFGEVERLGGVVTFLDPDEHGVVSPDVLERAIRPETVLVSIGWANSETGVLQPLRALSSLLTSAGSGALFHSDLGQAPLYRAPHVHTLGVDMAVMGSGKLYGPRGIAALYLTDAARIAGLSFGGDQERGLRAGTENPALAAGFAAAVGLSIRSRDADSRLIARLRDTLRDAIACALPITENTPREGSLAHILNISIPGIDPEYLVLALDKEGIAVSTKSACKAGEKASHVVAALGGDRTRAEHTIRFSLGRSTTERDIRQAASAVVRVVRQLTQ